MRSSNTLRIVLRDHRQGRSNKPDASLATASCERIRFVCFVRFAPFGTFGGDRALRRWLGFIVTPTHRDVVHWSCSIHSIILIRPNINAFPVIACNATFASISYHPLRNYYSVEICHPDIENTHHRQQHRQRRTCSRHRITWAPNTLTH